MTKATAKARITLEVEVDISQGWGADCTVSQVEKQAHDGAKLIADRLTNRIVGKDESKAPIFVRLISIDEKIIVEIK